MAGPVVGVVEDRRKRAESRAVWEVAQAPLAGADPIRAFSWRRGQRHRPGLEYLVSTGRHHGFESMEEARTLLALDFAGDLANVVSPSRCGSGSGQAGSGGCTLLISWR